MPAPGDLLIDDWSKNIAAWNAAGGRGILFRTAAQALADVSTVFETFTSGEPESRITPPRGTA